MRVHAIKSHRGFVLLVAVPILLWVIGAIGRGAPPLQAKRNLTREDVEMMMTSLSNWGRWGKDDVLGTLNLITPEKRIQAAREVREGVSVSLGADLKLANGAEFKHEMLPISFTPDANGASDEYTFRYHGLTVTHVDALCHRYYKGTMYNGISRHDVTRSGAKRLSITVMKQGLFTRAVLMDIPRLFGKDYLRRAIYPEDLDAWEKRANLQVERGDAVLIRTGSWARRIAEGDWDYENDSAGLHASCLPWLKQRDIAIVGSDLALDVFPSGVEGWTLPVHDVVIVGMGMHVLDNLNLEDVSEAASSRKRWSFLLTLAPLAANGGTGSPINPIATF